MATVHATHQSHSFPVRIRNANSFRQHPAGHFCPCGRPALKWSGESFVCQRCADIEARLALEFITPPMTPDEALVKGSERSFWQWRNRRFPVAEAKPGPTGLLILGHGVYAL